MKLYILLFKFIIDKVTIYDSIILYKKANFISNETKILKER